MKQILQHLGNGETVLADVPCPQLRPGHLLIRSTVSLISAGTERMLVEFGRAGWLGKARQQPDRVREVLDKVKAEGLVTTLEAVRSKLHQAIPLGYCNVGRVFAVGGGVEGLAAGDRVASNGGHAEMVLVPKHLCARIPAEVDDEAAAFTVLGGVALQSVRLAAPTLGEGFVVIGLGLAGLLAAQLLRAGGCQVLGIDPSEDRRALAQSMGFGAVGAEDGEDPLAAALAFSRGRGVDGVIIAAATKSNAPLKQAARMSRKRGRIVLLGVAGLDLERADFYEKELTFQVSHSYGPGRADPAYEVEGHDYPIGFVRWTEQRNFEAFLDMLARGSVRTDRLVTHRHPLARAKEAYAALESDRSAIGIFLKYPTPEAQAVARVCATSVTAGHGSAASARGSGVRVGVLGAGNYAARTLLPALTTTDVVLHSVVSPSGVSASHLASRFGFLEAGTDEAKVLDNPMIDAVIIATRHDSHARLAVAAIERGKPVFVEKPLGLTLAEIDMVAAALDGVGPVGPFLTVGFNRRFAPLMQRMDRLLAGSDQPQAILITVNAGAIPREHWTQDRQIGGGRMIGEGCHFIDLARHLAGAPIVEADGRSIEHDDNACVTLRFANGSLATLHYLANGAPSFPKERIEVFSGGRILALDNFRSLRAFGWRGAGNARSWRQDKGHRNCLHAFVRAIADGGPPPIPYDELLETSRWTITIGEQLRAGSAAGGREG